MTWEQFSEIFAMLAIQLRATDADEAMGRAYFAVLKDLAPELVALAAERMAKQGGASEGDNRHWFPKTSEWCELVAKIETERTAMLAHRLRELHKASRVLCVACDDTGWAPKAGSERYAPCACREMRRLEILGRRPMPALPPAPGEAA